MANFLTLRSLLQKFLRLNLSSLPSSNPGGGNPWLHSSGSIVVGAFTGGGGGTGGDIDGGFPNSTYTDSIDGGAP